MRCHETRQLFFLYHDSELDPRSVQEVNLHLESCDACRELWRRETAVEKATARAAWKSAGRLDDFDWSGLRGRLLAGMPPKPRRRWWRRGAALLASGALVAVALLLALPGTSPVERAALSAVKHHEKYLAGKSPLQVRGDPAAVREFYAGTLGFEVLVPSGREDAPQETPFALLGARRCTFLGGPVAYVTYRLSGGEATVILGPRRPPADVLESVSTAPGGILENDVGSRCVLMASIRGLLCTATGEHSREELRRLLEAFRGIAEDSPAPGTTAPGPRQ